MSVGPTRGPVQRPSDDRDFTEIFQRLDDLERAVSGIGCNRDNECGWFYLQMNADFDLDLLPDPLGVGGTWSAVIEEDGGSGLLIGSTTLFKLLSGGFLTIESIGAMSLVSDDDITIQVKTGKTLTVLDNASGPIFRVDEDGDLHGKTGKALTFDL